MKKAFALILALTMIFALAACGGSASSGESTPEIAEGPEPTIEPIPEPTQEPTPEPMLEPAPVPTPESEEVQVESDGIEEQTAGTLSREVCDTMVDEAISSTFGDNYVIDYSDNSIVIAAWEDSLTLTANNAMNLGGTGDDADSWNRLISTLADFCQTFHEIYMNNGHEVDVHFLLLNDETADQILLTIKNDEITFDIVNN